MFDTYLVYQIGCVFDIRTDSGRGGESHHINFNTLNPCNIN